MPGLPSPQLDVARELTVSSVEAVRKLAAVAADTDGVSPLDEDGLLGLRLVDGRQHVLVQIDDVVVGYGHRNTGTGSPAAGSEPRGELVVHPDYRRRGIGRQLVGVLLDLDPGRPLRVWAHGGHPGAAALAKDVGFTKVRELWRMEASLTEPLAEPSLPDGVRIRTFQPGVDDERWLALNARAFADHPEQGGWTLDDLRARMEEPWFDPAGFFLAERDGELIGFHWTKVHHVDGRIGEIYILGVDPDAHGLGLGKTLAVAGLRHLVAAGLRRVQLFVESDNAAAVALYRRFGFDQVASDVMYRYPSGPAHDTEGSPTGETIIR